jgi:hypothetical protein
MIREIFCDLEEGALDALRCYGALIKAPFTIARSVVARLSSLFG